MLPDSAAEVPDSIAGVPRIAGTQPPCLTAIPTGQPTDRGGWEGWILKNLGTMGQPNETTQTWLQEQSAERGHAVLLASLDKFLTRPSGFFRVTNPWALFISESARLIESALQDGTQDQSTQPLSGRPSRWVPDTSTQATVQRPRQPLQRAPGITALRQAGRECE